MKSRLFGFYSAILTLIVTAILTFAVAAQDDEWNAGVTPPEVVEENKRTGEETLFENRKDGSTRVTRTTFFRGTTEPWKQRVVTTSNGSTTISSVIWNEHGEAYSYTEEEIAGTISYAESKDDINWQGKQVKGTRWFFERRGDGSIVGEQIEEYLSPNTGKWTKVGGKQPPAVSAPSGQANSNKPVVKKPAAPAPAPNAGNNSNDEDPRPESRIYAPYDSPGRDQIAAALERNYSATKKQVDRPTYDDNEATRLLKEMESIFAFAEEQMLKEVPRSPRWQKFKDVKDQAGRDIATLKERLNKSKPEATLAGKWRLLINDQQQPGEFTFEESGRTTVLRKDSQLCLLVFGPNSPNRTVSIPADAEFRLDFRQQVIRLRGDAASNRLEFWATPDLLTPEFQKTKYALVREEKSR